MLVFGMMVFAGSAAPTVALAAPEAHAVVGDPTPAPGRTALVPEGWATVSGRYVDVHGPPRHERLMRSLADHADRALPDLADRMGLPMGGRVDVFVSTTDAQFRQVQPGNAPTWAGATAYPGLGAVYLRAPGAHSDGDPLTMVLDHELVHIVVGRAFAPGRPPTWLQEGLAQLHAEEHDLSAVRKLAGAAFSGPIPLDELEGAFPENPHAATLAYAESVDFLVWLERTHGEHAVPVLVASLRAGMPLTDAVRAATGEPLYIVDREWRSRLSGLGLTALASSDGIWLLTALIGLLAMFVVRRRQRRQRDEIRAREADEEALLQAIWEGRFPMR
jgi:hypothetical protein